MYDTCTICHSYIFITVYEEALLMLLFNFISCTLIKWFIFLIFKVFTLICLKYFISLAISKCLVLSIALSVLLIKKSANNLIKKGNSHIICISITCLNLSIFILRVYAKSDVRWKCPRCCCPCKEICIFTLNLESYNSSSILNCLISLCNFLA